MRTQRSSSDGRPKFLTALSIFIILCAAGKIYFEREISPISPSDTGSVRVEIPAGARVQQIAGILVDKGLARDTLTTDIAIVMSGDSSKLKAGAYALSRSMSVKQMIEVLATGKTDTVVVSIPEGFTMAQIAQRLADDKLVGKLDFIRTAATEGQNFSFQDGFAPPRNLEGFLYPLTYTVVRGSSPQQIARQMLTEFDRQIFLEHPEVTDWQQTITIASMVEREAKVDQDRPLIASVYYNRLRLGMPLQCDATVQYALPVHKARLMYSDLRIDSPYNTYLHRGLPPGPICNPGRLSIEAAIAPANTDYLYYVAGPSGQHIFSRTLAEQDREIMLLRGKS